MSTVPMPRLNRLGRSVSSAVQAGLGRRLCPTGRLVVVGSGKGGTGKTFLAANLAIQWSMWGQRVVLVDADLGLANLHILLGVEPRQHLLGLLDRRRRQGNGQDDNFLLEGPAGVRLLAGGSGIERLAGLNRGELRRLLQRLESQLLGADAIIVDLSAGLSPSTLHFLMAAEEVVLVSNPEPSAVLDAYAVMKVLSRLKNSRSLHLVMNRGRDGAAALTSSRRIQQTAARFLEQQVDLLGIVPEDEVVSAALNRRQPLLLHRPDAPAADAIRQIARKLLSPPERSLRNSAATFFSRSAELLAPRTRART